MVVEDEETGNAAKPVEALDLVPAVGGGRRSLAVHVVAADRLQLEVTSFVRPRGLGVPIREHDCGLKACEPLGWWIDDGEKKLKVKS